MMGLVRPPSGNLTDRNAGYMVMMMFWMALLSAGISFNSAYAVRLGASNQLIGLLSSGPALIVILATLPAARLIEGRKNRKAWLVGSILLQRALYLVIALMPFVVREHRAEVFVGLLLLRQLIMSPYDAGWGAYFADLIPNRMRTKVLANRRIIHSATLIVAVPLVGALLDAFTFPLGYQAAFGISFLAGMAATAFLWKLKVPEGAQRVGGDLRRRGAAEREGAYKITARSLWTENQAFVRFLVPRMVYGWGASLAQPLYIIYYLRYLGATDSWIGLRTSAANLAMMIGFYAWARLIGRWGELKAMRIGTPLIGLFPLLVGLSRSLDAILVFAIINGLLMPAMNLTFFNVSIRVSPAERRASYLSLYKVLINISGFLGPMIGVALVDVIGLTNVLFVAAGMRVLGGLLFSLWPIRQAEKPAAS